MYKEASKLKLRFNTTKGQLSVEQLWDLTQTELAASVKSVKKILKKTDDDELSFLDDALVVDKENQLRFDILKDVYLTKKKEAEEKRTAAENKAYNQKILGYIAEREEKDLKEHKSIDELRSMLR